MDKRILEDYPYSEVYFTDVFCSKRLLQLCGVVKKRVFIVADLALKNLYAKKFLERLKEYKINAHLIYVPSGESSKSREMKAMIEDKLLSLGADRQSLLIALGGGVITDLTGFVGATFYRGIDVIYLPTSLLAMVDATLGGKTGINTLFGKNSLGTFSSPLAIFIDLNFLATLPKVEYLSAFAEIIKHAAIADEPYFKAIEENILSLKDCDKKILEPILLKSLEIKASVVIEDKKEKGLREILNFGHTVGQALEKVSHYQLSHGRAVAIGMIVESFISYKLEGLSYQDYNRLKHLIHSFELNTPPLKNLSIESLISAMFSDKKVRDNTIRCVLLKKIGSVLKKDEHYAKAISTRVLNECLKQKPLLES